MIIAVAGSGGKTTLIKNLSAKYRAEGKTVLVTTTTHMFIEEDTLLTDDADTILAALREKGYAMAGIPEGEKIRALSPETFARLCPHADVVLVEADGSKHLPLKCPNAAEPVVPTGTDRIIVVWGPHGLGRPAGQVCHRFELAQKILGITADTPITEAHVRTLIGEGYLAPLRTKFPAAEICVYPPL